MFKFQPLEPLEKRQLLSVTVTEAYPGYYEVHGDYAANAINVSVSMNAETFTLNGVTYGGVAYLYLHGYGGDDTISVLSTDGAGAIGASVSAGDGNDRVTLNFDGAIWSGAGNDTLYLSDSFRGEAYGDAGNDSMYVSGECVDPEILGGDGDDLIDASQNHYGVVIRGGNGDDRIYGSNYNDTIYGDAGSDFLFGGFGNDVFYVRDGQGDRVIGGAGADTCYADFYEATLEGLEFVFRG